MNLRPSRKLSVLMFIAPMVIALAMIVVGFNLQSFVSREFDAYSYSAMGSSLARGEGLTDYGVLLKRRAPLYPLFIGALYFFFGEHPWLVQLAQALMAAGTCWLVFDMGRRIFSTRAGVIAAAICAVHPMTLRYVADIQVETLLTFLFTLTIWASVRFYQRPTTRNAFVLGCIGGAAALTKAVVVLYLPLFAAVYAVQRKGLRRCLQSGRELVLQTACMMLGLTLVIAPWTIRNYFATNGQFVLITTGFNDAFLRGMIFSKTDYALLRKPPYVDAENESNRWFNELASAAGTTWQKDDYETEQILGRTVRELIVSSKAEVIRKFFVGIFTFWYQMTSLANSVIAGLAALGAWAFALVGWHRAGEEERPIWLFLLPAIHLNLLLAALLALGRYSAPVIPALLVATGYGIDALLLRHKSTD